MNDEGSTKILSFPPSRSTTRVMSCRTAWRRGSVRIPKAGVPHLIRSFLMADDVLGMLKHEWGTGGGDMRGCMSPCIGHLRSRAWRIILPIPSAKQVNNMIPMHDTTPRRLQWWSSNHLRHQVVGGAPQVLMVARVPRIRSHLSTSIASLLRW